METKQPTGLLTSGPVVNADLSEKFGTHFDWLGIGGWRAVDSLAARDAIPVTDRLESSYSSGRRRRWMRVYVWQDSVAEEYELAISDADWNAAPTDAAKIALLADNSRWRAIVGPGTPTPPSGTGVSLATYSYNPRLRRLVLFAPDTTLRSLSVPAGQGRPAVGATFFQAPFFQQPFFG
jgi:hypothetical protein